MFEIYKVLDLDACFATMGDYEAIKCKQYAWAIYEDSRNFFWQRISLMDVAAGKKEVAVYSMLDCIIPSVRHTEYVHRVTFPLAWQDLSKVHIPPSGLPPAPSPFLAQ